MEDSVAMVNKHKKYKNTKYNTSIEEAYKLLTSKEKKHWMCNFKAVDPSNTGTRRKTRNNQVPSWFKKFHKEEFKPLQQAVIDLNTKPPKWFRDFAAKQEQFNQLVLDQFKKHGWIK